MSPQTVLTILIGIAVLIFISFRQMRWQQPARQLRMPLILGIVGVVEASSSWNNALLSKISGLDVVLIGFELCLAVLGGWLMGRLSQVATVNGSTQTRLRPAGLVVWFGFIALRIGMATLGGFLGATLASNTAVIIFMVAIVKGIQVLVVRERIARHELGQVDQRADSVLGS
ncbi:hypothetical protein GCM10011575_38130 [Microlunatus endophyticus]|uniref:DUF1453 domain-containing protein n=1 Tax=Microlunatus endophyticus TaxID=1716077 RepID=A0A917SGN6_9ACTN|nr:hypothetical protein [Microlunatus endophyticus]GGL76310.1 hypothetical protein GCM10011575_38130 [Microlunatus endophyticus]